MGVIYLYGSKYHYKYTSMNPYQWYTIISAKISRSNRHFIFFNVYVYFIILSKQLDSKCQLSLKCIGTLKWISQTFVTRTTEHCMIIWTRERKWCPSGSSSFQLIPCRFKKTWATWNFLCMQHFNSENYAWFTVGIRMEKCNFYHVCSVTTVKYYDYYVIMMLM